MLKDHIEDFLGETAAVDVVIFESNGDKALIVDNSADKFLQTLVKIVE